MSRTYFLHYLQKMVILFDKDTEKQSAEPLLSAGTTSIVWIDSDDYGNKLQQRVHRGFAWPLK